MTTTTRHHHRRQGLTTTEIILTAILTALATGFALAFITEAIRGNIKALGYLALALVPAIVAAAIAIARPDQGA